MPANAAAARARTCGITGWSQRSATRNRKPDASALVTAANRLIRSAYRPRKPTSWPQVFARITNSGLPGGCGIPSTLAAAMYSDVSQKCVVGPIVAT